MLIPAGMYLLLHGGQPGVEGWGVPMATDIAFSLGILQLLGKRVPVSMKVFLTAFAIVDDLGAILIIALFYSESFDLQALSIAGGLIGILVLMNRYNVRSIWLYGLIGIGIWTQFYLAGIHPTVAGVLVALTIPANPKINLRGFSKKLTAGLFEFSRLPEAGSMIVLTKPQIKSIDYMREAIDRVQSPVQRLENTLHNFVLYVIMPVFALANAGVTLTEGGAALFTGAVTLHVGISLLFGKLLGITAFSWAAVRSKLARLPAGTNWHHIIGLSLLGGIGFTMSLFISGLAFAEEHSLNQAKVGILIGSFLAGTAGLFWLNKHIPHLKASASESPQLRSKSMMDEY